MKLVRTGLLMCLSVAAFAQGPAPRPVRVAGGGGLVGGARWLSATHDGANTMYFRTRLEPAEPGMGPATSNMVSPRQGYIRRLFSDRERKIFFGYDARIEPMDANTFRVSFAKLEATPEVLKELHVDQVPGWRVLELPQLPAPQVVRRGDLLAFDLMVNNGTGQRIVEYTMVDAPGRSFADPPNPPRDFAITDAEMELRAPRLLINGVADKASSEATVRGAILVFYTPGHGRFSLSLAPHPEAGYVKSGEIRGESLTFNAGVNTYVLQSNGPIASGSAAYNLYVRHEAGYAPTGTQRDQPFFGSQDQASR